MLDKVRELEQREGRMREALEFYADDHNWRSDETGIGVMISKVDRDGGTKAQQALAHE